MVRLIIALSHLLMGAPQLSLLEFMERLVSPKVEPEPEREKQPAAGEGKAYCCYTIQPIGHRWLVVVGKVALCVKDDQLLVYGGNTGHLYAYLVRIECGPGSAPVPFQHAPGLDAAVIAQATRPQAPGRLTTAFDLDLLHFYSGQFYKQAYPDGRIKAPGMKISAHYVGYKADNDNDSANSRPGPKAEPKPTSLASTTGSITCESGSNKVWHFSFTQGGTVPGTLAAVAPVAAAVTAAT